jgi:hypothetical protein
VEEFLTYNLTIEENKEFVRFEISGVRIPGKEKEHAQNVFSQIAKFCHKKQQYKLLGIFRLEGKVSSSLESYNFASSPEEFGWDRKFKLALVDLNEESRIQNLFTENVAVNRGYNFKVFDNEASAIDWLLNS